MNNQEHNISVDQWLKTRKEAGLKIDPETAEVGSWHGQILDPYGIEPGRRTTPVTCGRASADGSTRHGSR